MGLIARKRVTSQCLPRMAILTLSILTCARYADAAGDWVDYRVIGPLEIRSEFRLDQSLNVIREVAKLRTDIEDTLKLKIGHAPVKLHFFSSQRSYARYLADRVPEGARTKALYVKGPDVARVYAYKNSAFDVDVRHESTHAILHSSLAFLPLWLDEGLAEYFEVEPRLRVAGNKHLSGLRWAIRFGWKPKLANLERKDELSDLGTKDYRDSWAIVHFLLHESIQSKAALTSYLQHIQNGQVPGPMSQWIAKRVPNAERRIVHHLKTWGR